MFKIGIPNYSTKRLQIGGAAGGSNGARWAKPLPHPQAIQVLKHETEIHGKGGKKTGHAISPKWDDQHYSSRRGPFTVRKNFPISKNDPADYTLHDYSGDKPKELSTHDTLESAKSAANARLDKLGATSLAPYKPPKDVKIEEPPGEDVTSVGLLIREPDGRVWIREPSNHFGGYQHSFPKGTIEPGETLQEAAHREVYEETGLKAKITGFLGDFHGDTSTTRMYIADRDGGTPLTNDETWALKLVTPDEARTLLNRERDKNIISEYQPDAEERWLLKHYNGDEDRVATELLANSIYRTLGVDVPKAGMTEHQGRTALTYPARNGEIKKINKPSKALGKDFMVDALLANWDVIGLDHDNVLWDKNHNPKAEEDHPIRLDQGGTLQFRAMGGRKDFGNTPAEVWSMTSGGGQAKNTMDVSPVDKRSQATKIYRTLTPSKIDDLVDQAPFEDEKMREEVREALKGRVHWMGQFGKGMINEKEDAREPTFEEVLQDDVEKSFSLTDLANMRDLPKQKEKDPYKLHAQAEKAHHALGFMLNHGVGVEQELDSHVYTSNSQAIPGVKEHPDNFHVIMHSLRGEDRADKGNLNMVSGTVLVPHPANLAMAIKAIRKNAADRGWKPSGLKTSMFEDKRFPNAIGPEEDGFRDMTLYFQTPDGFQVEINLNSADMWLAANSQLNPDYNAVWKSTIEGGEPGDIEKDLTEARGMREWPKKGAKAVEILGSSKDTQELHSFELPDGTRDYTDERKVVHDKIMDHFLSDENGIPLKPDPDGQRTVLFMGGGPASGKSSALALDDNADIQPKNAVNVNPDDIKEMLPEYEAMVNGGDRYAAMGVHEESSDLSKRLLAEAMRRGLHIIRDGTGNSGEGKFAKQITDMTEAGYEARVFYVNAPTDVAVKRAAQRARRTGRWVPEPEIRNQHKNVSARFVSSVKPLVEDGTISQIRMYQTEGNPQLIADGGAGVFDVIDQTLYDGFVNKSKEKVDG